MNTRMSGASWRQDVGVLGMALASLLIGALPSLSFWLSSPDSSAGRTGQSVLASYIGRVSDKGDEMSRHRPLSDADLLHMRVRAAEIDPEHEIEQLREEKARLIQEIRRLHALVSAPAAG